MSTSTLFIYIVGLDNNARDVSRSASYYFLCLRLYYDWHTFRRKKARTYIRSSLHRLSTTCAINISIVYQKEN
jgi:hypothetical protein